MTIDDRLNELQDSAEKLLVLLKDRQMGLMCWWTMTGDALRTIQKHIAFAGIKIKDERESTTIPDNRMSDSRGGSQTFYIACPNHPSSGPNAEGVCLICGAKCIALDLIK